MEQDKQKPPQFHTPQEIEKGWENRPYDYQTHAKTIQDLFTQYPQYHHMTPDEWGQRIDIPAMTGHLEHWRIPETIAFTWARPYKMKTLEKLLRGDPLEWDEWGEEGERLWIVDLAADPSTSGVKVGRFLSWVLAELEIAEIGEMVFFRRNSGILPGRFGKAIVRG